MDKAPAPNNIADDVLHIPAQTRLTAAEIAKARAHHDRHHPQQQKTAPGKQPTGKKQK